MEFLPPGAALMRELEDNRAYVASGGARGRRAHLAFEAHEGFDLAGADLMEATLQEANLRGCRLDDARLGNTLANGLCLQSASLARTDFTKAELVGADFGRALAPSARFLKSRLTDARFDDGKFTGASFSRAVCLRASFRGADLADADFTRALLSGADFSGADVSRATFTERRWTRTPASTVAVGWTPPSRRAFTWTSSGSKERRRPRCCVVAPLRRRPAPAATVNEAAAPNQRDPMSTPVDIWRPSLYREGGFAQAVAAVRDNHLLCAMIDWDREVSPELQRLGAAAAAAAVAACDGDRGAFPTRFLEALHARLLADGDRLGILGVAAAAAAVSPGATFAGWVGDVRVRIETADGGAWSSTDHTIAALASRAGGSVPAEDQDQLRRVVAKVVGRIGNPLDIETREIRGARAHRAALLSPAAHRYEDPDLDRWPAARAPLPAALPLDGLADAALFVRSPIATRIMGRKVDQARD